MVKDLDILHLLVGYGKDVLKSLAIFSRNVHRNKRTKLLQLLNVKELRGNTNHLHNPISINRHYGTNYNFVLDIVQNKLEELERYIVVTCGTFSAHQLYSFFYVSILYASLLYVNNYFALKDLK